MYVRIYWGRIEPRAWPTIEEKYRSLMEISAPGLLARIVTQDANDPESMFTITIWKDRQSIEDWEGSPEYRNVFLAAVRPFIVGSQTVSLCEVKAANFAGLAGLLPPKA